MLYFIQIYNSIVKYFSYSILMIFKVKKINELDIIIILINNV